MTPSRPIAITPPVQETVESLTVLISALCAERQDLRSKGAGATALERNRVKIARAQWELSHALIERYLPKSTERAA